LRELELTDPNYLAEESWGETLGTSPYTSQLQTLRIHGMILTTLAIEAGFTASNLFELRVLDLSNNRLSGEGASTLAASPLLRQLRELDLSDGALIADAVPLLASSPHLSGLRKLNLSGNGLRGAEIEQMLGATSLL